MHELVSSHKSLPRIAKLYLATQFFGSLYFAWPIFYGFATQAITPLQVGIYFSVGAIIKIIAEVPTGAFGDKYGRRRSSLIGTALAGLVPLVMYFGHDFTAYLVCAALLSVGGAFLSGSLDSMVYDDKDVSKETYRRVAWLEITFCQVGLIVGAATSGFLFELYPGLPFFAEALAWGVTFLLIWLMKETYALGSKQGGEAYVRYFKTGLKHLLATTYLKVVVAMGVLVAVIMTAGIEFVNEASMIFYGLEPSQRGMLIAVVKILAMLVVNLALLKLLKTDRVRLIFVGLVGSIIFLLLSFEAFGMFLIGFVLFNWVSATNFSFFKTIIHDRLPSSHRATAISGFSALTSLVAFGAYALIGWMIELFDTPLSVYRLCAVLFVVVVIPGIYWLVKRTDKMPSSTPITPDAL